MKLNQRIMQIGLGAMLLTLVLGIIYTMTTRLDNPVFLRYSMDVPVMSRESAQGQAVFILHYLTNISDERNIMGISFLEAEEFYFNTSETTPGFVANFAFFHEATNQDRGQKLGKYSLRTIFLQQTNYFREDWTGEKEVNTAIISFNDGTTLTADIGRIVLYSDPIHKSVVYQDRSEVSNDYSSISDYRMLEDVRIEGISSPLLNEEEDLFDLKFDEASFVNVKNMHYLKGHKVKVTSAILDSADAQYDIYDLKPKVNYQIEDGTRDYQRLDNIRWQRSLDKYRKALIYLRERGAL